MPNELYALAPLRNMNEPWASVPVVTAALAKKAVLRWSIQATDSKGAPAPVLGGLSAWDSSLPSGTKGKKQESGLVFSKMGKNCDGLGERAHTPYPSELLKSDPTDGLVWDAAELAYYADVKAPGAGCYVVSAWWNGTPVGRVFLEVTKA